MDTNTLLTILGWGSLIHIGILLYWWIMLSLAHDFVYRFHTKWFKISVETFDAIHYALLGGYKLLVFLFYIVPFLILWLTR